MCSSASARQNTLFAATDPADVEANARQWCDGLGLSITHTIDMAKRSATATVMQRDQDQPLSEVTARHPCEALLAACVEARQRLGESAAA